MNPVDDGQVYLLLWTEWPNCKQIPGASRAATWMLLSCSPKCPSSPPCLAARARAIKRFAMSADSSHLSADSSHLSADKVRPSDPDWATDSDNRALETRAKLLDQPCCRVLGASRVRLPLALLAGVLPRAGALACLRVVACCLLACWGCCLCLVPCSRLCVLLIACLLACLLACTWKLS